MSDTLTGLADAEVIALAGEIDPGMVIALHRRIDRALDAGATRVVLDLGDVTILGCHTTSVLCAALRRVAHRRATVAIAGSPPHLQRVLELCAIDRLEHYPTGEAALMAALLHAQDASALPTPSSGPRSGTSLPAFPQ